jgi:long-chain-fatty-acid--CoA ligase ACSBG
MHLSAAGWSMYGTKVKIHNENDKGIGEICLKGRNIMMGYLKNEKATMEVIDEDGYFHSGDLGRVDERGFVHITGRIKELIITAGGENIAPIIIEE